VKHFPKFSFWILVSNICPSSSSNSCRPVYCVSGDNGERGLYWATSDNEETCDVIEVPLQPGDLAFIISGTHHGVHHVKRKVPRITLNIFM
jgi:hypothetical protein